MPAEGSERAGGLSPERARELMSAVAEQRDKAAFRELYLHYGPRLESFLRGRGADPSRVEDLVQEVMIALWRRAGSFDPTRASVSTWLFTVARNRWIDLVRKERRPEPDPGDPSYEPPESAGEALDAGRRAERLRRALLDLPPEQSDTLRRAYYEGQTLSAIAAATGVALGTVKSRVRLAMGHLRRALETRK